MEGEKNNKNYPDTLWGFSLIETLIVVSVLIILSGLIAPGFLFFKQQSALNSAAQEIIHALRLAQNRTLASEGDSSFGVYFETDKFVLFKGQIYSASSADNEIHNLDPSLNISSFNLGNAVAYVVFDRLTGTTANYGSLTVGQDSNPSQNATIYVDQSGVISLADNPAGDDSRQKDSRHVEVLFSQGAKNAATLALIFPNETISENLNFQSFLNAEKSEFYWEGTIMVEGQEQRLKIHTHSLTDTAALFCIHRDRRYNTKSLNLYLDGENLLNYTADGTISQGLSAWSGIPQIK